LDLVDKEGHKTAFRGNKKGPRQGPLSLDTANSHSEFFIPG
jgi:hypothetical protein